MKEDEVLVKKYDIFIAGHLLRLTTPLTFELEACLPSFLSFITKNTPQGEEILMEVELCEGESSYKKGDGKILTDTSIAWEHRFAFEEVEEGYLVSIEAEKGNENWQMLANRDFSKVKIYFLENELYTSSVLSWCLMMTYGQAILKKQSVMLHASVIERYGDAYAFLGKSGTGKSTHSQLWLKYIEDTTLLNDDNPVVRLEPNGKLRIYGTPWSGKTPCYINEGADLKALVRLRQAEHNSMKWLDGVEALIALMPSCTAIRWNMDLFNKMIGMVEKVVKILPIGKMDCLPNKEAALKSFEEIVKVGEDEQLAK